MHDSTMQIVPDRHLSVRGRFSWSGLALMIVAAPLVGLTFAQIGEIVQSYFAPLILFPILMGVFIGLTVVALSRFAQSGHRPTILSAAVVATVVSAAGGTGVSPVFWSDTGKMPVPPAAEKETGEAMLFALFASAAAVAVAVPAVRVPYCNQCWSWFRTIGNGKIDLPTSGRLAELLGVEQPRRARSPRYRLSACRGDCGPTCCELSWERPGGGVDLARVWLDGGQRSEVVAILDELNAKEC